MRAAIRFARPFGESIFDCIGLVRSEAVNQSRMVRRDAQGEYLPNDLAKLILIRQLLPNELRSRRRVVNLPLEFFRVNPFFVLVLITQQSVI